MRNQTAFILLGMFALHLFQCGKGEKKKEFIEVRTEKSTVKVEVPQVSWEKSIAVFPMEGGEISPDNKMISTMITEEIISSLSKSKKLKILSVPPEDRIIQEKMKTDYLLKSYLEKKNDSIRASFYLIDTNKDSSLWTSTYEDDFESVLTITENAASSVAQTLGKTSDQKTSSEKESHSSDLLTLYLTAKSHLAKTTREENNLAVQKFKEVLRMDSTFALACVGLAESYLQIVHNGWDRNLVWLRLAQEASRKAILLDDEMAEAYLQLGQIYLARGDFKQAETEFRTALGINPNLEKAWTGLGNVFIHYGLYEPCLQVYENTLSLNPEAASVSLNKSMILIGLKRYSEAEEEIRRTLRSHSNDLFYHSFLALIRYYQNDLAGASKEIRSGLQSEEYRPFSHAVQSMILAKDGRLDESLGELELEVKPFVGNDPSLATAVAAVHSLLNQKG